MKKLIVCFLAGVVLVASGCQGTGKKIIPEGVQDHQHFHSRTKAIGDYHAQLVVNHRSGKLFVVIYDIYENSSIKRRRLYVKMYS